jgi:glycosyltransferase involved in cell wall biosynthesis
MRVLVLTPEAFGGQGGIAKYNRDLLTALAAHPLCTEVVAIPRILRDQSGRITQSKLTYVTKAAKGKAQYVTTVLREIRQDSRYDLIVCAHINLLKLAYLANLWVDAPIMLFLYGIDAWESNRRLLTRWLLKNISAFVTISEFTRGRFLSWSQCERARGFVLPNAFEPKEYGVGERNVALVHRYGIAGKTVLLTLGRLDARERYKGVDEILEILPMLAEIVPDVVYLIVGDGTDRQRLQRKAKLVGVDDRVVFAGAIPEAEKADHYRLAAAYVMPSRGEGFGFAFLEAMACGVPVVASEIDGSREAVRNGALGILVNPNLREQIVQGILQALNRPTGAVPEGLEYFTYANFERRCHLIVDEILFGRERGGKVETVNCRLDQKCEYLQFTPSHNASKSNK